MMITLAVDNGRQGKVDQLGLECVVGVTLTKKMVLIRKKEYQKRNINSSID
ncbi:hypothetical protein [Acinetobacter baumannii]|uniref:hypothetical protein n=1 Tax=Acinetobacter baumannii TaxID=470 RepID=UPI00259FEAE4|nr:hypothetical protein [Acinetobacter baumannii]MDR9602485.1 hypothetical protein [Acinetobacter baumannii]MDR9709880.1 hypothetical protein [Acinetobacter baumannii]